MRSSHSRPVGPASQARAAAPRRYAGRGHVGRVGDHDVEKVTRHRVQQVALSDAEEATMQQPVQPGRRHRPPRDVDRGDPDAAPGRHGHRAAARPQVEQASASCHRFPAQRVDEQSGIRPRLVHTRRHKQECHYLPFRTGLRDGVHRRVPFDHGGKRSGYRCLARPADGLADSAGKPRIRSGAGVTLPRERARGVHDSNGGTPHVRCGLADRGAPKYHRSTDGPFRNPRPERFGRLPRHRPVAIHATRSQAGARR